MERFGEDKDGGKRALGGVSSTGSILSLGHVGLRLLCLVPVEAPLQCGAAPHPHAALGAPGGPPPPGRRTDRRAAGNRLVRWVFQRHLETVLYGRSEGSSGPIWKVMNQAGIGATTLAICKANVVSGLITDAEYNPLLDVFKSALPADVVDPSSLGAHLPVA